MEGPVDPTRRFIEVPRPDNPNLMDVYEINEEAAAGRDDDLIRASLTAPQSRPPGRIGAKARTNVVNMPSADDADPLTPENDNNRANRRAFKNPVLQGDDPDGDGENLRKRAREDSEQVFGYRLYDWQNGTPLDDVSFDAIKRHLHRLALHTVDPVVSFVAGVAFASGSGADNFFVNGTQKPSINLSSRSMRDLVNTSGFEAQYLIPLLALAVLQLFGKAAQTAPVTELQTGKVKLQPGKPEKWSPNNDNNDSVSTVETTPLTRKQLFGDDVKIEPTDVTVKIGPDASPMDVVRQAQRLIGNQAKWDQHHAMEGQSVEPLGINMDALDRFRAAREFERRATVQMTAFDELRLLFEQVQDHSPGIHAQRWYWNSLPENSGMSLVKPEVRKAIYDTFEDIRALSESHRRFKLWHLMTSPGVSGHFSLMCGARIASFPGEILYPNYQGGNGFRNNGDPRGSRVTNGLWTRNKAEITYNQKRRGYFPNVRYTTSETWQMLQAEIPRLEQEVTQYRGQLVHLVAEFRTKVAAKGVPGSLLSRLGFNHPNFNDRVRDLQNTFTELKLAEKRKRERYYVEPAPLVMGADGNPMVPQMVDFQEIDRLNDERLNAARLAFEASGNALDDFIENDKLVNGMAGYYPWRKIFRRFVLFLYPLSLDDFLLKITPRAGFVWDLEYILAAIKKPLEAMNEASKFAANVFDPNSIDGTNEISRLLFDCIATTTDLAHGIARLQEVMKSLTDKRQKLQDVSEDEKMELRHFPDPNFRKPIDWSQEQSPWASY